MEKVIIEDGRAVGVVAGGEEYRAPIIVSNADVKRTVFDLVGEENLPADYVERIKNAPYSLSSPVIRCGLDTVLADPDKYKMCGTFYSGGSMHEYFDMLARKELPDEVNLFLVIPSNFDKGVAPEGKQLVMMATAVPFDLDEDFLNKLLDRMVDTAEGIIPGLREHALFMDVSTPKSVDGMVCEDGATIGLCQGPGQVGADRVSVKSPIEGLYLVGGEAGGAGVGTELCCNSAMELFDKYLSVL